MMIDIQLADDSPKSGLPADSVMATWVRAALQHTNSSGDVCIRIVGKNESHTFNKQYRGKDNATNVLSFPADISLPDDANLSVLGDLVICAAIVAEQAQQQQKAVLAHWAHMVIHGTLHLCGFDHIDAEEADRMEAIETHLLAGFGFADPYTVMPTPDSTHKLGT